MKLSRLKRAVVRIQHDGGFADFHEKGSERINEAAGCRGFVAKKGYRWPATELIDDHQKMTAINFTKVREEELKRTSSRVVGPEGFRR